MGSWTLLVGCLKLHVVTALVDWEVLVVYASAIIPMTERTLEKKRVHWYLNYVRSAIRNRYWNSSTRSVGNLTSINSEQSVGL